VEIFLLSRHYIPKMVIYYITLHCRLPIFNWCRSRYVSSYG
jgi:hypothetical protein